MALPLALPLAKTALSLAPTVLKGIGGLIGIGKGRKRAKENIRPVEKVDPLLQKNLAIAENEAAVGLPQQQYNNARQNINRNTSSALRGLGRSANPGAGLSSMLRASNDAVLDLDVADANARAVNSRNAMGARSAKASENARVWDWNNRQKYLEEARAAAEEMGAGKSNAFGALTDLSKIGKVALGGGQDSSAEGTGPVLPNRRLSSRSLTGKIPYKNTLRVR